MSDNDSGGNESKDRQQTTDEKARVADTPEEDPRESGSSGDEED